MACTNTCLLYGIGLALVIATFSTDVQAAPESARCEAMVQDRIAWDAGNPNATHWEPGNLARLCGTSWAPEKIIACFQQQLVATQNWSTALDACIAATNEAGQTYVADANEPDLGTVYTDQGDTSSDRGYVYQEYVGPLGEGGTPRPPPAFPAWIGLKWAGVDGVLTSTTEPWQEPGAAPVTPLAAECRAAVQDNISWNPDDPTATGWTEEDLSRLCQSTAAVRDTVACFTEILSETRSKEQALSMCSRLHPSGG